VRPNGEASTAPGSKREDQIEQKESALPPKADGRADIRWLQLGAITGNQSVAAAISPETVGFSHERTSL